MTSPDIPIASPIRRSSLAGPRVRAIGLALVLAAILSGAVTFLVLTGLTPYEPTREVVVTLLTINVGFAVALLILVAIEIYGLKRARSAREAGAALQLRVITLFSIIAAMPAVLVAIVASITLDRGLDNWFSTRTRGIIETSLTVANAYVQEQGRLLRGEALAMTGDLNRAFPVYFNDRARFLDFLKFQAQARGLPASMMITGNLEVTDRADIKGTEEYPMPPREAIGDAQTQDVVIIAPGRKNVIGAVVKLRAFEDRYLFVARPFDPRVAQYVRETQAGAEEYRALEERRFGVQVAFALLYVTIALIMLLAAIWAGLAFAKWLVEPIRGLINAANQVAGGNLKARVSVDTTNGDLATLGATFNNMTETLLSQRNDLLGANELADSRRRFMEAVLSGVSAGVIGVNDDGVIVAANPFAERLTGQSVTALVGSPLATVMPELADLLTEALAGRTRLVQGQIAFTRAGIARTLNVRVTSEARAQSDHGFVVTLDDISDLVTAQRSAAWADVARRIAHEIKNPLTPIQLSAERIRRRYGRQIADNDREVFDQCTDTIVRQVDDIKRMVDEFSSFARMPKPMLARDDLSECVRQVVFLMRVGNPDIDIDYAVGDSHTFARFDRRLISQAVTNIVKNATEAIAAVPDDRRGQGRIVVRLTETGGRIAIEVIDNGIGLPVENRGRLLEPYVTTREKGTGLGLAIVGKIMEDHGGGIELTDAPAVEQGGHGAMVRLWLPALTADEPATDEGKAA